MTKELQALERIKEHHEIKGKDYNGKVSVIGYINEEELDIVETALKALEIIKEKKIDVALLLGCDSYSTYNSHIYRIRKCGWGDYGINQQEYDLLKEYLR